MTDDTTGAQQGGTQQGGGRHAGATAAGLSCSACGEPVYADETFCERCGHRLAGAPPQRPEPVSAPPCEACGGTARDAGGRCESCGRGGPGERDHIEITLPAAGDGPLAAAGVSDRGRRYSRNEDALALAGHASGVAAVVSDGVGSAQRPQDASRAAADTGAAELAERLDAGEDPEEATREAALRAAAAVAGLSTSPADTPSCTYVSAVTRGATVTVGWVGDSRVYWLAANDPADPAEPGPAESASAENGPAENGGAEVDTAEFGVTEVSTGDMAELGASRRLTEDDSWAAFMIAEGSLTEAEADAHPNAHVITAWLGGDAGQVRPHVATFRPQGPGVLLVCSDGLWNYFPATRDLAALLAGADPARDPLEAARTLVRHALDAGGRDNITVAVVPFGQGAERS